MKLNTPFRYPPVTTHEGGPAKLHLTPIAELKRSVMTCLLWENTFYEKGDSIAARIESLIPLCNPAEVAQVAVDARNRMYLRHVPLFLVRQLAKIKGNGTLVADTLAEVIQRPDELTEYLAMYWKGNASGNKKRPEPLSAGSKRGLARAFRKFNAHTLAKYDRDGAVKLRDVLRLVHAKPNSTSQAEVWKHVIARDLETPDTWEVNLSKGADKKETFERLLRENKLGALAFIRNLRNMIEANVDHALIRARFNQPLDKVLPFRYIAAYRNAPAYAHELNGAMLNAVATEAKLSGRTHILVDVSGSMDDALSGKSEMKRKDAANGLAVLVRELSDQCRVFTFSDNLVEVPSVRGMGLVTEIERSQSHSSTMLGAALRAMPHNCDRIIVITDEQSHDRIEIPNVKGYIINVASYKNGIEFGGWTHINGWSERVVDFIRESEV